MQRVKEGVGDLSPCRCTDSSEVDSPSLSQPLTKTSIRNSDTRPGRPEEKGEEHFRTPRHLVVVPFLGPGLIVVPHLSGWVDHVCNVLVTFSLFTDRGNFDELIVIQGNNALGPEWKRLSQKGWIILRTVFNP